MIADENDGEFEMSGPPEVEKKPEKPDAPNSGSAQKAPQTTAQDIKAVYENVRRAAGDRVISDLARRNPHVARLVSRLNAVEEELEKLKSAKKGRK